MSIDPNTLAVTLVFVSGLLGGLQIFSWAQARSGKDLLFWGLIFLLISLAVGLLTVQGRLPDLVSVTLGQGLLVLAHGLLYSSTRIFNGKPPVFLAGALGAFAWLAASAFHFFATSTAATTIFVSLLIASYSLLLALEFWRMAGEKFPSSTAAAVLATMHGLFFIARAVAVVWSGLEGESDAFTGSWAAVLALEALMATVALGYLFLSLSKERVTLQLRDVSRTDELTEAGNRRAFFELGEKVLRDSKSQDRSVSLLLIDVDWFKQINDSFGHAAGDKVLRAVSMCVAGSLPPDAVLARLGGDEFAALLPGLELGPAGLLADHIRERIYRLSFAIEAKEIDVAVSIGVAESKSGLINLLDLLSAADSALYIAKSEGRNRVHMHSLADLHLFELDQAQQTASKLALRKRGDAPKVYRHA